MTGFDFDDLCSTPGRVRGFAISGSVQSNCDIHTPFCLILMGVKRRKREADDSHVLTAEVDLSLQMALRHGCSFPLISHMWHGDRNCKLEDNIKINILKRML